MLFQAILLHFLYLPFQDIISILFYKLLMLVANEIDPDLISPVDNGKGGYDLEIRAFSSF